MTMNKCNFGITLEKLATTFTTYFSFSIPLTLQTSTRK